MILDFVPLLRLRTSMSLYDQGFDNKTEEWRALQYQVGLKQVPKLRPATPTPNVKVKR